MQYLLDVLGVGSRGGDHWLDGKGVDFSSLQPHPSVIAKVPCCPVQQGKSEQGSAFQAPQPPPLCSLC